MGGPGPASVFSDPDEVARYAERPARQVPGFLDLQKMASQLLAERVPEEGSVLVLGAGGGLELRSFATAHPGWRFCGVDPSAEMLGLARRVMGGLAERAELHEGYIHTAPEGPFDGATSLLTLHFLDREERAETLAQMHRRLKPGAPLVVAHHSVPSGRAREEWLARSVGFYSSSPDAGEATKSAAIMAERLPLLTPEEDEEMLASAGFGDVALFYAGFSFRGWIGWKR